MIDTNLTLEQLENNYWGEPEYPSSLVINCHKYRKIPVKDLEAEHLRLLIGQNIGLKFLVPIAIERLKHNILEQGDFYPGDLLKMVLECEVEYWQEHPEQKNAIILLLKKNELLSGIKDNRKMQKSINKFTT
jgi:hypothetical protein